MANKDTQVLNSRLKYFVMLSCTRVDKEHSIEVKGGEGFISWELGKQFLQ